MERNLMTIRADAISAREAAAAAKLFETDRDAWYRLCNAVIKIEAECADAHLLCGGYDLYCKTPTAHLTTIAHGQHFCSRKCSKDYWDEVDGEAAVRAEDMRDY